MSTTIASLLIELGVDTNDAERKVGGVDKAMDKAEGRAGKLGKALKQGAKAFAVVATAAAAAGVAVFNFVDNTTKTGDEIGKTAKKIGVGVEELQRLRFAADRSGASAETLNKAVRQQSMLMDQAARNGAAEFRAGLESVGLTLEQIEGLNTEQRIGLIGDKLKDVADPAKRTAAAMALFGAKAGSDLVPLLLEGSKGISALGDQAEKLGLVMGEDGVSKSEAFQDAMTNARAVVQGLFQTIAVELIPVIQDAIDRFSTWAEANRDLIRVRLVEFMKGAARAAEGLIRVVGFLLDNFGALVALLSGVTLAKGLASLASGLTSIGVASSAALGPLGAIMGALIAIIPWAIKAGDALGEVLAKRAGLGNGPTVGQRGAPRGTAGMNISDQTRDQLDAQNRFVQDESRKLTKMRTDGASRSEIRKQQRLVEGAQTGLGRLQSEAAAEEKRWDATTGAVQEREAAARRALEIEAANADAAAQAEFRAQSMARRGGGGGGRGRAPAGDPPVSGVTLSDLGLPGADLDQLAAQTPAADEIEPTIALTINNLEIAIDLDQSITSSASAGEVASEIAGMVREAVSKAAGDALTTTQTPVRA